MYIIIIMIKQNSKLIEDQNIKIIIKSENEKKYVLFHHNSFSMLNAQSV